MPVKAPVPVAAPWSWTGFYVGGHIGGALENSNLHDPFGAVSFGDSVTTTGFIAGGQVGANYQIGNVVIGATADLSWVTSRGDETCFGLIGGNFFPSNCSVDPTLFSTLTGRLGYAFGRTLFMRRAAPPGNKPASIWPSTTTQGNIFSQAPTTIANGVGRQAAALNMP